MDFMTCLNLALFVDICMAIVGAISGGILLYREFHEEDELEEDELRTEFVGVFKERP